MKILHWLLVNACLIQARKGITQKGKLYAQEKMIWQTKPPGWRDDTKKEDKF